MKETVQKLLLVIPINVLDDLQPIWESEGWNNSKDLFRKTSISYNIHWNGNYVVDQDEIPWKASREELSELKESEGCVVVLSGSEYKISEKVALYCDRDGSFYVLEDNVKSLL